MKQIRLFSEPARSTEERHGQLELFGRELRAERPRAAPARPDLARGLDRARAFAGAALAPNTRRAYAWEWKSFAAWCGRAEVPPLPASGWTVAIYLAELAEDGHRRPAGIKVALAAICKAHEAAGAPSPREDPAVRATWRGIRRELGTAPHQKRPLLVEDIRKAVAALPNNLEGLRDRALLLLGWSGGFRRSELVALRVGDVRQVKRGLKVIIRRSKKDQEGKGRAIGVARGKHPETCPVAAVAKWIERARIEEGALFRRLDRWGGVRADAVSGHFHARLVKRAAALAGLDPREYSGHSLRAGFTTAAAEAGKTERQIMRITGHASEAMVRRYIREAELIDEGLADLGL